MSRFSKLFAASEQVRQAYRRKIASWQVRPAASRSGLDDLIIDDGLLADKASGLLHSKYLKDETLQLVLSVPGWVFSDKDTLRIEHSRDGIVWSSVLHEETIEYFKDPIKTPYPITLDKTKDELRLEGDHYFRTWIKNDSDDFSYSAPLKLIFDRVPPYNHAPPAQFPAITVVTDASLSAAGGKATLTLPDYSKDWAPGDTCFVYWMNRLPENFDDLDLPVATVATTGKNQSVDILEADIRRVGDGGVFVLYVLVDLAGNVSQLSVYTSVAVALGTLPTVFGDPVVPLATAADGYLIDQADANEGVEVWIPLFEGWKKTDVGVVKWGTTELPPEAVGSVPGEYIRVRVPNEVMQKEYGTSTGAVDTKVSYTLLRGTHLMGGAETDIKVDFETMDPGGPDPSWPVPIHPGLKQPVITGKGSRKTDELDTKDNGLDAELEFELYDFADTDDELTFYWGGMTAITYKVLADNKPGDIIKLEVPWSIIEEVGNSDNVPVDYEARRARVHNPVRSAITSVKVDAIIIVPQAVTYEYLVNGLVTCASIQKTASHPEGPAVEVLIPDLTEYLEYGAFTEVVLKWWVYRGRSDEQGFEIIEPVTLEVPIELDAEHPVTGFTWRVPFETNVEPTYEGGSDPNFMRSRANVTYTLKRDKGDLPSAVGKVTLAFIPPSGVCDPNG